MLVALITGGSCSSSTGLDATTRARVVVTTRVNGLPAMFVQDFDGGNRTRLLFQNVADQIPGNVPNEPVRDERLVALGTPRWNSDGTRIAVLALIGFDQSEVVVMDADGRHAEVASYNGQIIFSKPIWSPDGQSLAYCMSTQFSGQIDVFVTDLATHTLKRLTTGANLKQPTVQWVSTQAGVYYSHRTGDANDGLGNSLSEIALVDVATGQKTVSRSGLVGDVQAISTTGVVLLRRNHALVNGEYERDLVQLTVSGPLVEQTLVSGVNLLYADPAATQSYAILVLATVGDGQRFELLNLSTGARNAIAGVASESNVDVFVTSPE